MPPGPTQVTRALPRGSVREPARLLLLIHSHQLQLLLKLLLPPVKAGWAPSLPLRLPALLQNGPVRDRPKDGLAASGDIYPKSADVLRAARLRTIGEYIARRRQTVLRAIADRPILEECREAERQQGSPTRLYSWEQEFEEELELMGVDEEERRRAGSLTEPRGRARATWVRQRVLGYLRV